MTGNAQRRPVRGGAAVLALAGEHRELTVFAPLMKAGIASWSTSRAVVLAFIEKHGSLLLARGPDASDEAERLGLSLGERDRLVAQLVDEGLLHLCRVGCMVVAVPVLWREGSR